MVERPPRSAGVKFVPVSEEARARYIAEELEHEAVLHQALTDAAGDAEATWHRPGAAREQIATTAAAAAAARAEWWCSIEHLRYLGVDTATLEDEERRG